MSYFTQQSTPMNQCKTKAYAAPAYRNMVAPYGIATDVRRSYEGKFRNQRDDFAGSAYRDLILMNEMQSARVAASTLEMPLQQKD